MDSSVQDAFYFLRRRAKGREEMTRSPVGDVLASSPSTASTATHARRVNEISVYASYSIIRHII